MAKSYTTNYSMTKPDGAENIATSAADWNTNFDTIDTRMKTNADAAATAQGAAETAQDTADAAIPKSIATAENLVLISSGAGTWASKTYAQFKTWLALAASDISNFATTVRATVLTGLSTASSAAVTAADSVLAALGKLQAQITAHVGLTSTAHGAVIAATANTLMTRDSSGRSKVATPSAADDISNKLYVDSGNALSPWVLIQEYLVAGTYTFTAPDLFNGADYDIGAFIIGAGGSGAAIKYTINTGGGYVVYCVAIGGASGYTRALTLRVTPGNIYTVVVGAGGLAAQTTTESQSSSFGHNGGSSSFNGISVNGGEGGTGGRSESASNVNIPGATGGQGSDARSYATQFSDIAPAMGQSSKAFVYNGSLVKGGETTSSMSINPFNIKKYLGAGGGAVSVNTGCWKQSVITLDDGFSGGAGEVGTNSSVVGHNATSPGSGGGGAVFSNNTSAYGGTATSGAGADGAVMIYARKAAS